MPELAVIMAAGLGSRLRTWSCGKPKGFVPIGGQPIIERSLQILFRAGIRRIVIGTGHGAKFYENLAAEYPGVETVYNPCYASSGSFFTLYAMQKYIEEDLLLLESDLIYDARAVEALLADEHDNVILASTATYSGDEVYIETDDRLCLVNMSKRKLKLNRIYGELVGISRLSAEAYQTMISQFASTGSELYQIEYETALIRLGQKIPVHVHRMDNLPWAEIDTEAHLRRAKTEIYPLLGGNALNHGH
ncbi:NTP transferase domain-containing protein [Desulfovermiculus halophilus]|jgi:2-aminoethylphosphonate-pyruvate transaminase|uniref:phosphocholine cytidylyltransferase family protein n=1 Tax=Desulfovermiculus halophilus TaxID=339722 RepID=UPI000484E237|nr:phosphocholine cytidylyltransferase family protein [Desulfovermiculus halophilus]